MEINYLIEKDKVIETLNNLFIHTDNKDWKRCKDCFTENVHFDMSSLGGEIAVLTSQQIIDNWETGLAPIEAIHHQTGNHKIDIKDKEAIAFCYGIALHFLRTKSDNNTRTFVGSYKFHLTKVKEDWLIDSFKFNLKFIYGNLNLENDIKG